MPISTTCPVCNWTGQFLDEFAGMKVLCRRCKRVFTCPKLDPKNPLTSDTPEDIVEVAVVDSPTEPASVTENSEPTVSFKCYSCSDTYNVAKSLVGKLIRCRQCGDTGWVADKRKGPKKYRPETESRQSPVLIAAITGGVVLIVSVFGAFLWLRTHGRHQSTATVELASALPSTPVSGPVDSARPQDRPVETTRPLDKSATPTRPVDNPADPVRPTPEPVKVDPSPSPSVAKAVTVPNVVGMTSQQAQQAVLAAGLRFQPGANPSDASIFQQNPASGTQVASGSTLSASFHVKVPDLVGGKMDVNQAKAALGAVSLALQLSDNGRTLGPAVNQLPKASAEVRPDSAVSVLFQTKAITVPSVLNLALTQAQMAVTQAGLAIVWTDAATNLVADTPAKRARLTGPVVGVKPDVGTIVAPGSSVTVACNTVAVPNLVNGARYNRAADIPQYPQLGLSVVVVPGFPTQAPANKKLVIIAQDLPANAPLPFAAPAIQVKTQVQ